MGNVPQISALSLISAFFLGMAAACSLLVMINYKSINIYSPELILMIVSILSEFIWRFIHSRFFKKSDFGRT